MDSKRGEVVAALAEAFFPALDDEARRAQAAGKSKLAHFLKTSGGSMTFAISEARYDRQSLLACPTAPLGF